jgi:hypothetical protein
MSNYNWCHGTNCHTIETQSRVRGTGDNKVLRTIRIKQGRYNWNNNNSITYDDYFCNQRCLMDFIREHLTSIIAIAPRREALETPIKVEKVQEKDYYNNPYTRTSITRVNNDNRK